MKFLKSERAASELVGKMIILSLTVTGVAMITLVGVPSIYRLQEMANVRDIEQAYTLLDSRTSKVALGEAPLQIIDFNLGGGSLSAVSNSSGQSYILLEFRNGTGNILSIPISMGKIVYKIGDREVAYEGGGVWSKYPEGSVMLSPPEFNYNGITLTFPTVTISGNSSIGGKGTASLTIEKKGDTQMVYPNGTYQNPIPDNVTQVVITIKSEYYDAWADYFESIDLVSVNPVPGEKKVSVILQTPPLITNFSYGALASDKIDIKNNADTDSYNSSIGKYSISRSGNGSIRAARLIDIGNGAVVNGSALTSGDITGGGTIRKNAYANSYGGVTVIGTKYPAVGGLSLGSTVNLVQSRINEYEASNDNNLPSAGGCLSGAGNRTLDGSGPGWSGDTCTMSTGNYYLTTFDIDIWDILKFNTQSGAINIAVDSSPFEVGNNANITVIGNNPVRFYLNGEIAIGNNAEINHATANDTSALFQIVSSSPQQIDLSNNAYFYGFIWAPEALIIISNNAYVYGAMVGKTFELGNNEWMHFDEALQNLNTEVGVGTTVLYVYMTSNEVEAGIS